MDAVIDVLKERGFVQQMTEESALRRYLAGSQPHCYVGFDPTAASLHAGSLVPIMALMHMQRHGVRPIAILGGGTAMIGDPSGKTEMRQMLDGGAIGANTSGVAAQLERYLDGAGGRALVVNNAEWLLELRYVDFLREIGRHFSVNRMLAAEAYRLRLETGLSFLEFNYQILQAYDFLVLFDRYGCRLQMGGDDQWGNCLAGMELIRRVRGQEAHVLTFPLLTTATGAKMGKTEQGALWLDPDRTSPYEFYQYWVNVDDRDVERFLGLFTFLPMAEVRRLGQLEGADRRAAKQRLAFEATRITHGDAAARGAEAAAQALFGGGAAAAGEMPETVLAAAELERGLTMPELLVRAGLARSRSEGRRLIEQGGVRAGDATWDDVERAVEAALFGAGRELLLRVGKKRYHRVRMQ